MASSTLMGDRRWAPSRKSGMTVLGKVPKPINLPSQRLENHGLDPNVEIVPKGTITWGNRISSTTPNVWASSGLSSPNTDGSAGSPANARPSSSGSGPRPSSGGSGPRPSTAGSDRSHDLASNAWGPNSRPSSSSGALASNPTLLVTTRPQSAETRPGSSQLSRFAENLADNSVAWGPTKTSDRLGTAASRNDSFTLSSGDFPTLGSEKNSDMRGHSSQGRPASASGRVATQKDVHEPPPLDGNAGAYSDQKTVNSWKVDNHPYGGFDAPQKMEKWERDPQQAPSSYSNANMPPHQFEPWHGPSVPSPDGVWYRGGPSGGPYRPPGPHVSYAVEPFQYYSPHFPGKPSCNSQVVPRPGAGPSGYNLKNVESYPHPPHDSYVVPGHPVIPFRPGVYPGQLPYEGYYGPHPTSFQHSIEREVPVVEMNAPPAVGMRFNRNPNLDTEKFHVMPNAHDPSTAEQKESDGAQGIRQRQYKVLIKQHDDWEDNVAQDKRPQTEVRSSSHVEIANLKGVSVEDCDRDNSKKKNERSTNVKFVPGEKGSSHLALKREVHSSGHVITNSETSEMPDDITKKPILSTVSLHASQQYPVMKKTVNLMEKIESLNNKARIADAQNESRPLSREKAKNLRVANVKDQTRRGMSASDTSAENHSMYDVFSPGCEVSASLDEKKMVSTGEQKVFSGTLKSQSFAASMSDSQDGKIAHTQVHRKAHVVQGRVDHHAKSRPKIQDDKELMKIICGRDSPVEASETTGEDDIGKHLVDRRAASQEAVEAQESHHATISAGGSYTASSLDSVDHKTQRVKLKEIAAQRARQLQEEEEERTREQKAKALAKLEELNRRTSTQSSNQNMNHTQAPNVHDNEDSGSAIAPQHDASIMKTPGSVPTWDSNTVKQQSENVANTLGELSNQSLNLGSQPSNTDTQCPTVPHVPSLSLRQDSKIAEDDIRKTNINSHDSCVSKPRQMGYRRRQNISQEKNINEKPIASESIGSPKNLDDVNVCSLDGDVLPKNEEPSVQQRKKNNRGSRNRNKVDEAPLSSCLPSSAHSAVKPQEGPTDSGTSQPMSSAVEVPSVSSQNLSATVQNQSSTDAAVVSSDQGCTPDKEELHGRVSNQWKPQPYRRSARNHQATRPVDKFHGGDTVIWAPVKPSYKSLPPEEPSEKNTIESSNDTSGKNALDIQNNTKTKRAEMERYVPKHVAKELTKKDQQPSSSQNQAGYRSGSGSKSPESSKIDSLTTIKSEVAADNKIGEDNKLNRRGRVHASWRQRNSAGSSSGVQSSNECSVSSDLTRTVQERPDQDQSFKFDNLSKAPLKQDDWNSSNDNMVPTEPVNIPVAVKDQGVIGKQKRQQFKTHKFGGSNLALSDNKDVQIGTNEKSGIYSTALDLNESDSRNTSKESQNVSGDHTRSHWQPKSQAYSHNQKPGSRGSGDQRVGSQSDRFHNEPLEGTGNNPGQNEDKNALTQGSDFSDVINANSEQSKGERKAPVDSSEMQSSVTELAPPSIDVYHEQSVSSAHRHHGQYNGRFYRGRGIGQDGSKQNFHTNGDRGKNSSHYEYQQIGSYNKCSDSFEQNQVSEEGQVVPRSRGSKYRERGPYHSRRGNQFYG